MNYWLVSIPFIAALTGWLIHTLAIQLLFRPWKPVSIAGFRVQGVLPKRQQAIAKTMGRLAAKEFQQFTALEDQINDPKTLQTILPTIDAHIDHFLNEKLKVEMPMIAMFVGQKTTDKMKEVFMKEIELIFPEVIGQLAGNLKTSIDIEQVVTQKIASISPAVFEQQVRQQLSSELRFLQLLGLFSGLIIGLVLVLITVLTS